jgi:glycosyltransferase involved in cell wall biosynthesis
MPQTLISVVIPCHNASRWLRRSIESALSQTYRPIEIIVVDDGSTDDSATVAREFKSQNVVVISQSNRGNGAARNRGLQEAKGDYIQYLDADDLLAPTKVAIQVQRLAQEPAGSLASGAWARFFDDPAAAVFRPEPLWRDMFPVEWLITAWRQRLMMHPAAWLVPRPLIEAAGPWSEVLLKNVDGEYFTRVVLTSRQVLFCADAKVYYRSGNRDSVSQNIHDEALASTLASYEFCANHLLGVENTTRTRQACAELLQHFIYDWYPRRPDLLQHAQTLVERFGGAECEIHESKTFRLIAKAVGWKAARRLQSVWRRIRYGPAPQ